MIHPWQLDLFTLLFSFYSYAAQRDLHSFPTRRSSDLEGRRRAARAQLRRDPWPGRRGDPRLEYVRAMGHDVAVQDRKSTRLNSSHTVISYAVFCLKKKIKPARTTSIT